jgi:glutathione S-transferase
MVLKLYGTNVAGVVRLVACVLREKKVPHEFIDFSKNEHKSAKHLEKQVPYIVCDVLWLYGMTPTPQFTICLDSTFFLQDDDGFILYGTKAICYYITAKYPNQGTPLPPTELKANALFQQETSSEIFQFSDNILKAAERMMLQPWVFRQDHLTECPNG